MIIDCISALHGFYPELEGGDLLIVAGDLTASDKPIQYGQFAAWMQRQNYSKKVLIAGNHDSYFQDKGFDNIQDVYSDIGIDYLCDSGTEFEYWEGFRHPASTEHVSIDVLCTQKRTIKIWGSPWTKTFYGINPDCCAFTVDTEEQLAEKWALIPADIDILITHSPPRQILDVVCPFPYTSEPQFVGSLSLRKELERIKPKIHVFGHIHGSYGQVVLPVALDKDPTKAILTHFINASHVNEKYQPVNKPIRIEL